MLGVGCAAGVARRLGGAAPAAALAALLGTPLLYYATLEPMSSHAYGAALLALALWLAATSPDALPSPGRALAIGAALGMAMLVRWQLALYAAPACAAMLLAAARARSRAAWASALCLHAGFGCFVLACMVYFRWACGSLICIPTEGQSGLPFLTALGAHLPEVLLDAQHGWIATSPAAALGMLGLLLLAMRGEPRWRALALVALAGVALQVLLNGSLNDWFGGWAFGQRRMTEAYVSVAFGLAALTRPRRWRVPSLAALIACGALGVALLCGHIYYSHTNVDHPAGGAAGDTLLWLATQPHGPPFIDVFRDRYGPWSWARPEW